MFIASSLLFLFQMTSDTIFTSQNGEEENMENNPTLRYFTDIRQQEPE